MKTLIITVGTRQVGWRCRDGIVRSLGADGDRGHPQHIDQLYAEFELERGYHGQELKPEFRWSVRHLGEHIYQHCQAMNDFSNIELLLDSTILATKVKDGLDHVILWGTDQPERTPWNFRRADTLWLAKLMEGKIHQVYPQVQVDVWNPVVAVNETDKIRHEVEGFILKYALDRLDTQSSDAFTLLIQTKGSVPQIANTLEICAAALMRQCPVEQLIPIEPSPLFDAETARIAKEFTPISLGQYFWPVERERIISAWERGDFTEAKVWLESHRDRYEVVCKLANHLAVASNGEIKTSFSKLRKWCNSKSVTDQVNLDQIEAWQKLLQHLNQNQPTLASTYQLAWEGILFIELALKRGNCTIAFMQFAQLLERLMYIRGKAERWVENGIITSYNVGFWGLLGGWLYKSSYNQADPWPKLLNAIREKRNKVVHAGKSVSGVEIKSLWRRTGFDDTPEVFDLMMQALHEVAKNQYSPPSELLLRSLHQWGIERLKQ